MARRSGCPARPLEGESGLSLVEIVVAMFILAVMSIAVLPLIIGAVQASAVNRDLLAANSLANARLAALQAAFPNSATNSCAAVTDTAAAGIVDPSGSGTTASVAVGVCPSSYPGTVKVTVRAFRPNTTKAILALESAVLVSTG